MRQIAVIKGDTMPLTFTVTDSTGTAVNLTGSTVRFTVKKKVDDPDNKAIIAKSWSSHTNAVGGITDVTLTKDDTFRQPGSYLWDFQITGSGGAISTCDLGEFIIKPHVTVET
jgi:hypothetical protein